ncbi:hypothetical protein C7212DRAFT_280928 [Tuber magnatum]|uniref:Uncharacterized protein n=1 Tax=Tuber magnatum TaxID=42249 RepID=A0A317SNI7_9PEZI|nr:hypothetical protein C7212DRAFT_280928 [Tuber magnatum]
MGYQNENIAAGSPSSTRATRSSSRPAPQADASPSLSELPDAPRGRGRPRGIAPKPAPQRQEPPKKRGRPPKRKLSDENWSDDDVVVIESASTPAPKTMEKGKQSAVPIAFAPPYPAPVAPPGVLQPFPLVQEPPQKQARVAPSSTSTSSGAAPEKRAKLWRKQPPKAVSERIGRCLAQRMVVLDRQRDVENDIPQEIVKIAGSTGNVYTVHIRQVPICDCPDSSPTCKHILYVMMKVLKARSDLVYQAAQLSSELREIFEKAPPTRSSGEGAGSSAQKPLGEDDCPICYCPFEENGREAVVYCKAQCGTNVHQSCFRQWASTKGAGTVTCVMCRQPWQGDSDPHEALAKGKVNDEGYVNVASELGMSGHRDYSTYHYPPYYGSGFRRRYW